jgi:ABC-type sugar transport system ATPase subunit
VFRVAHRVTVLKDGEVVGTRPITEVSRADLIQMMVGRSLEEVFPAGKGEAGEPVLVARSISTEGVHDCGLTLYAGEILGVAGMVGSGRTELARALFGADPLKSGAIWLHDRPVRIRNPGQAVKAGLSLVPEDRKAHGLFPELSIRTNITLAILKRLTRFGVIQPRREAETVQRARANLSIAMASMNQEVQYLSGGNQQKICGEVAGDLARRGDPRRADARH